MMGQDLKDENQNEEIGESTVSTVASSKVESNSLQSKKRDDEFEDKNTHSQAAANTDHDKHDESDKPDKLNFGSIHPNQEQLGLRHMQSLIDPSKQQDLYRYDQEAFKNTVWENFIGSQIQISTLIEANGKQKVTNKQVNKMGPVQLNLKSQNLYSAWEESRRSEIEGYKGVKSDQQMKLETWVCRPPNILMFSLNRVNYNINE